MTVWTPKRIEQLRSLWDEGHTATQIALIMGDGLTKNSILGACHRSGLSSRPSPIKRGQPRKRLPPRLASQQTAPQSRRLEVTPVARAPEPSWQAFVPTIHMRPVTPEPKADPQSIVDDGKRDVAFADLAPNGCKWAVTAHHAAPSDHKFCNAVRQDDSAYCPSHTETAHGKAAADPPGTAA